MPNYSVLMNYDLNVTRRKKSWLLCSSMSELDRTSEGCGKMPRWWMHRMHRVGVSHWRFVCVCVALWGTATDTLAYQLFAYCSLFVT